MEKIKFSKVQDPTSWDVDDFEAVVNISVNGYWKRPPENIEEEVNRRDFVIMLDLTARKYEEEVAERLAKELSNGS